MNQEIEEVIVKLRRLGCKLFMDGGKIKYHYKGNSKSNKDYVETLLNQLKIVICKIPTGKEAAINLIQEPISPGSVRCSHCNMFNPGIRRGLCMKFERAWNGEQLQSPFSLHQCSSFVDKNTVKNNNNRRGKDGFKSQ